MGKITQLVQLPIPDSLTNTDTDTTPFYMNISAMNTLQQLQLFEIKKYSL